MSILHSGLVFGADWIAIIKGSSSLNRLESSESEPSSESLTYSVDGHDTSKICREIK